MATAHQIVLAARRLGRPQLNDLGFEEIDVLTPASPQLLLNGQYLSLDPCMRGRIDDRRFYAMPPQSKPS